MKRFEYKLFIPSHPLVVCDGKELEAEFNILGQAGWQFCYCAAGNSWPVFIREINGDTLEKLRD